ncbi:hypothetical protein CAJAP_06931 [Camponotus japonicus]
MMMQLRILLHIFLLLFFVGIVFGRHASLSEKILERKPRATNEHVYSEVIELLKKFIEGINILCNCKELKEVIPTENLSLCKLSNILSPYFKL